MSIAISIGTISLNIAFTLYLIVYIPQIIHNQKSTSIVELSLGLHFLLYISNIFDLFYGFSNNLPWQYKTVSVVGLIQVNVQHLQLIRFFIHTHAVKLTRFCLFFLLANGIALSYFFAALHGVAAPSLTLFFGAIARVCGLIYCLPQILKNKLAHSARGISIYFIYLSLLLAILDAISSWTLNWGWPNKLAAPANILIMLCIFWQSQKYVHSSATISNMQRSTS